MDLERINLALRPRGEWEAIDLGLRLAQRHTGTLYHAWLLCSAPVAIILGIGFIHFGNPIWAFLLFWLLKPLFDRVLLHLFGRLIFDDVPGRSEIHRIAMRMPFQASWLRAITWGRLDLSRSFNLPVWQLEGLRGSARSRRAGVLGLGAGGAAIMLSLGAFAAVGLLFFAVFSFVMSFLVSELVMFDMWSLDEYVIAVIETIAAGGSLLLWASFLVYYLCECFIAPFYVGAGFCLYLNRRTHIEAWDVELQFRRALKRRGLGAMVACATLAVATLAMSPAASVAHAQEPAEDTSAGAREEIHTAIEEILADGDFGRTEKRTVWQEKSRGDKDTGEQDETAGREKSVLNVVFGSLAEIILWSLLLIGLVLLFVSRERWLRWFRGETTTRHSATGVRSGLLLDEDDVPADLPDHVRALWQEGRKREAVSLLYRGTLTILNEHYALRLRDSDTEGDCMRRVRAGAESRVAHFFTRVARNWQRMAYAHDDISDSDIDALCGDFATAMKSVS